MFDICYGGIELTTLVLVISVAILLPVQLLLCFKGKSLIVRLLPVIILFVLAAALIVLSLAAPGWDGLGYTILAIFAGFMLLMCGISWCIWAVVRQRRKNQ